MKQAIRRTSSSPCAFCISLYFELIAATRIWRRTLMTVSCWVRGLRIISCEWQVSSGKKRTTSTYIHCSTLFLSLSFSTWPDQSNSETLKSTESLSATASKSQRRLLVTGFFWQTVKFVASSRTSLFQWTWHWNKPKKILKHRWAQVSLHTQTRKFPYLKTSYFAPSTMATSLPQRLLPLLGLRVVGNLPFNHSVWIFFCMATQMQHVPVSNNAT